MNLLLRFLYAANPAWFRLGQNIHTLARKQGQLRSIREARAVRDDGTPVPWYTYPAIEYLLQFDFSAARIFEYGAGNSSLFWAGRAREVVSVENEPGWCQEIERIRPRNLQLLLRPQRDAYVNAIREQQGVFDLVIVDGKWRHACVEALNGKLVDDGMILFDNSDRYPDAVTRLRQSGWFQVDFSGFGPINNYAWTTSLFLRAPVRVQQAFANPAPIAGRGQVVLPGSEA